MRVAVFGASGKVGRRVTEQLLNDGHEVTAFVHRSSPFMDKSHLSIISGDVHKIDDVKRAVKGADAVICALGSWGTKSKDIVASGTENIIAAALENKTKRVITLTGSDATARGDSLSFFNRLIHFFIKLSPARKILSDGERHITLLENSGLDWTALRSPVMNNRGDAGSFVVTESKPKFWQTINRQSVAEAMVNLLEEKQFYKQAPYIKRAK